MNIQVASSYPQSVDTVVRFVKENTAPAYSCPTLQAAYDAAFGGDDTTLKANEVKTLRVKVENKFVNLVIVGFDCAKPTAMEDFRKAVAKVGATLNTLKSEVVAFDKLTNLVFTDKPEIARQFASVLPLCEYAFDKYLSKKSEIKAKTVYIISDEKVEDAVAEGVNIAKGIAIARDLTNEPAETLTPAELANRAVAYGKQYGFETQVFSAAECEKMGMGLFLAVGRASVNEPKFIVMRYNGGGSEVAKGVIGKGLTYDSGGLFLKPGAGMDGMKGDMAGSAAVIGAMCAIAANKVKKNVVTVVAACENLVDGTGYRNGDIFTGMGGKSVYIASTDAEGRLTMADAIAYIKQKEQVDSIIELSTLTGSCASFYGGVCAGVLTTTDELFDKIEKNTAVSGEKYGRMPTFDEYKEYIKSPIADLYNSSTAGAGGICAGMFLNEFADGTPFLHVDVAGVTFTKSAKDCQPVGGTGWGVKTVYNYIKA